MAIVSNHAGSELEKVGVNDLLDQLEIDLSRLGQLTPEQAALVLIKIDLAYEKIAAMEKANRPAAAEKAQFSYLVTCIEKNSRTFLKDLGGKPEILKLRETVTPNPAKSWWFPDVIYEKQTQKRIQKFLFGMGMVFVVIVILVAVYNLFLKPDPVVLARYNLELDAERALEKQDFTSALSYVNQGIALGGNTASLRIMRGAIEFLLGQKDLAEADFNVGEAELGDHLMFLNLRAETWIRVGQPDLAEKDATDAVLFDPSSAQALFYLGKAQELKQNYTLALEAYQKASDLAEQQGKPELNATIRVTMAMMMQSNMAQLPTIVVTPGSTRLPE